MGTSDDAGVFRVSDDRALVQTVDFFTPIVDDPYDWGRVAAANALSDVYAMGGTPVTALQLVGWPREALSFDLLAEVQRGGSDVMASAGCTIVGGHSIDDQEPTYGFAVTGFVHPDALVTNAAGTAGDQLVLTKPLGSGIVATAIKRSVATEALAARFVDVMATLNDKASEAMLSVGASCATDVTGYGLLGHLREVVEASGVGALIDVSSVPVLDGVRELAAGGVYPGGSGRNLDAVSDAVDGDVDEVDLKVLADAQTSGGLLIAVAPDSVDELMGALAESVPEAAVIGELVDGDARITLR